MIARWGLDKADKGCSIFDLFNDAGLFRLPVAHFCMTVIRNRGRGDASDPAKIVGDQFTFIELQGWILSPLLDDDHIALYIFAYDKPGLSRPADGKPFPLADCIECDPIVLAEQLPFAIFKLSRCVADVSASELFKIALADGEQNASASFLFFSAVTRNKL